MGRARARSLSSEDRSQDDGGSGMLVCPLYLWHSLDQSIGIFPSLDYRHGCLEEGLIGIHKRGEGACHSTKVQVVIFGHSP